MHLATMKEPKIKKTKKKSKAFEPSGISLFLHDDEIRTLINSATSVRPHTEAEIEGLIEWAATVRIDMHMLNMSLSGRLLVEWADDEPAFESP
jgi:hypothetical protein